MALKKDSEGAFISVEPTVSNPVKEVVMCNIIGEDKEDYIVKVEHKDGRTIRIAIPKDFKCDDEKLNTIESGRITGLNTITWGHYP